MNWGNVLENIRWNNWVSGLVAFSWLWIWIGLIWFNRCSRVKVPPSVCRQQGTRQQIRYTRGFITVTLSTVDPSLIDWYLGVAMMRHDRWNARICMHVHFLRDWDFCEGCKMSWYEESLSAASSRERERTVRRLVGILLSFLERKPSEQRPNRRLPPFVSTHYRILTMHTDEKPSQYGHINPFAPRAYNIIIVHVDENLNWDLIKESIASKWHTVIIPKMEQQPVHLS
ncbi:hypothetical protein LguiA_022075 [Lonicera macranthoides]